MDHLLKYIEKGEATYDSKGYRGLNLKGKIKFFFILRKNNRVLKQFYADALQKKECYIGPFIGEFGNFLLHILPFLSHLHAQGVKINYCGLHLHAPFLLDEEGKPIVENFTMLRDFFSEAKPSGNKIKGLPDDVKKQIVDFISGASESHYPYLNIFDDNNLYWYSFRNWQLDSKQKTYDLSKVYKKKKVGNAKVVIFPRKMNVEFTKNNGGQWDYSELGEKLCEYFDEVVFIGHPEYSNQSETSNSKIKYRLTGDNEDVLRECASAHLIVTQHSGAMHVGGYVQTPVLLIFKGQPPIKGLDDSIRFRKNFDYNKVFLAFDDDEIEQQIQKVKNDL